MNRLSWPQIRANAAQFADDYRNARYERGETQTFYNDFFQIFGVKRRQVATFEEPVKKLGNKQGFIDLFWKGTLIVEQKSAGRDLKPAREQALDYFPGLKPYELPRYVLVCDFQFFELYDLELGTETKFALADLPSHVEAFGFIMGVEKRVFRDQDPVNIAASELMGELHDALESSGYGGHELERLLVRLLFCLFADDTGIFETRGLFETLISERTDENGSDVGLWLSQLFEVLNEPDEARQANLDADLRAFPYINGDLFAERLRVPAFNGQMRQRLLEACAFDWAAISPAIFGALFQSVMDADERRKQGAHYTSERNILKVIGPLFMDDLRAEFERTNGLQRGRRAALETFHGKLAGLTFFDPACGCGNFLVIAYRELRALELDVLRALRTDLQRVLDISTEIRVNVNQFYGIEINEFPARIAEVALWMTDHIENNRASLEFGQVFARIPLLAAPHIRCADALEFNWSELLPAADCDYILGNPPFVGAKVQSQTQREQVRRIAELGGTGGTLDFVCAWFLKAASYAAGRAIPIGFVATNSITQGEQVAQLWPLLFDRYGLEIAFAHRTFAWQSDARGGAHVHVVIVGLTSRAAQPAQKRLFSVEGANVVETRHAHLSAYLTDASRLADPHLVVREAPRPINGAAPIFIGSKPIDGGHLIFNADERAEFLKREPQAEPYLQPFIGARELINGDKRWILALQDAPPQDLRRMPLVRERLELVAAFRAKSKSKPTNAIAATPGRFHVTVIPREEFLIIPKTSSETRDYIPIAYTQPPAIPSDATFVQINSELWHFAILTSAMNMAWLREIGGRLESRFRYSIGIVYNNFPWPEISEKQRDELGALASAVLAARSSHAGATLGDLYDRLAMPSDLRAAHARLDRAVEKLYRAQPFESDVERVEHLLGRYEALSAPLLAQAHASKRRRR